MQALGIDDAVGKVFVFGFYYLFLDVYFAGALGYFGFEGEHGVAMNFGFFVFEFYQFGYVLHGAGKGYYVALVVLGLAAAGFYVF